MTADAATTSLVITTYNWPQALALVLDSVRAQQVLPGEVVVADDGSRDDTRQLLERAARDFPVPLRHCWQEDAGFRAARSRNRAIAAARGDYVLLLDGDMVLHARFVADHGDAARAGGYVQGSRVLTSPTFAERMLAGARPTVTWRSPGIERRRNALRLPWLSRWYQQRSTTLTPTRIKTCNQGWWRSDLLALNGFDERYEGWGREDEDLAVRAGHAGLVCRQMRFAGLAFHLHHRERHQDGASPNDGLLALARASGAARAPVGIDRHLPEFQAQPLPDLRARG
jgi:glycosyltransferase involved in cell wall biosynthesis